MCVCLFVCVCLFAVCVRYVCELCVVYVVSVWCVCLCESVCVVSVCGV